LPTARVESALDRRPGPAGGSRAERGGGGRLGLRERRKSLLVLAGAVALVYDKAEREF
jgi:hypothetical protein